MRYSFFHIMMILSLGLGLQAQDAWPDKKRILPESLRKIPVAIYIQHDPNPNYPELNTDPKVDEFKYVWKHSTMVCSPSKDLKVIRAGSYIWYDESGWKENVQFDRRDFKNKFECAKGDMKQGQCYTYKKNYRWGNDLYGGDALWFVIAEDEDGKLYKGIGLIETEVELIKTR